MKKTNSEAPERCYDNMHLSPAHYGFLSICRSLANGNKKKNGLLYFSGRKMTELFGKLNKETAYKYAAALVDAGWLKVVSAPKRKANGLFSPTVYRVLNHEEWAAEHPGSCGLRVRKTRNGEEDYQSGNSDHSGTEIPTTPVRKNTTDRSGDSVHNLSSTHKKQPIEDTDTAARCIPPPLSLSVETGDRRESVPDPPRRDGNSVLAKIHDGDSVQVVPDTVSPEYAAVADTINGRLRTSVPLYSKPWEAAVAELAKRGISPERTLMVFNDYVKKKGEVYVRQEQAESFVHRFNTLEHDLEKAA